MKRPNLLTMGTGEEFHSEDIENIFSKIIEKTFPSLEKEMPIQVQEA